MAPIPSLEVLRGWLARDQAALTTMSERLTELEAMDPSATQSATRNALSTWDRSIITECSRHLDVMEQIEKPSKEERSMMSELHKLVFLGDHMIERVNLMQATIRDKSLKDKKRRQEPARSKTAPELHKESEEELMPQVKPTASTPDKVTAPEQRSKTPDILIPPKSTILPVKVVQPVAVAVADNLLVYDLLGVTPDAPIADIKKAIRKQIMQRHPDRLPGDADASSKFADFKILCATFDTEDARKEYDNTGEVEDVDDLAGLVTRLKLA